MKCPLCFGFYLWSTGMFRGIAKDDILSFNSACIVIFSIYKGRIVGIHHMIYSNKRIL